MNTYRQTEEFRPAITAFPVGYTELRVHFSSRVDHDSATDVNNYRLSSGLRILDARIQHNGRPNAGSSTDADGGTTVATLTTDVMNGDLMDIDVLHAEGITSLVRQQPFGP